MNAENYPPINVLNIFKAFPSKALPYQITPFRFTIQDGNTHHIAEIRHFHKDRVGKGFQFNYVVVTKEKGYFRLLFDTNTISWRLIEEKSAGVLLEFKVD